MELHGVHKIFHPNHLGEEKQQMLNLNRRLETYLSRVKCLEEENEMLANEIKVLRHNNQGTLTRRRGLEEELRQARLEVDAAWRERVLTEVEVQKLTEEIQALEIQRQMEAETKMLAKTKMEQSRKELEDEQRAQIWLREKVNQLEHEMKFLIQTHEEDVAHLEATLSQSRAEMLPNQIHRSKQTPDLLKMGHEFSQRATRAWQEASEAYQGQLAQLEESLDQARSRLSQVCLEKRESQLKLQTLEKEMASAQDVRLHLEKTVAQRRDEHCQEIQELGEHLEELEVEKVELGQQIDHLLQENHSLMQMKMSLGLEVSTYRALLDGEGLGRDAVLLNKPRSVSVRDAVLSPYGVKKNYPIQPSASLKTTYPSSGQGRTGSTVTATQFLSRRSAALREPPKTSSKLAETAAAKSATVESPYPKIVQNGAAENFRPEEVHEKVTYAEPLSPPNEKEAFDNMSEDEDKTVVERVIESVVSHTAVLGLSREEPLNEKAGNQQFTALSPTSCDVRITELPCNFSDELLKDLPFEGETEEENVEHLRAQADGSTKAEHVQDETSDSETEAMLEPTFESRPSSPESECEPLESAFNRNDESISNVDAVVMRQESSSSTVDVNGKDDEDKLYPDGEEMDTWDSVIERKVSERIDNGVENEGNKQHAEPEDDISTKDPEENRKVGQEGNMDFVLPQVGEGHHAVWELEHVPPPDKEDGGDEDDSQNVSVSWRTELESDSYAQDNTLADTRPLIRYKSDDTDANTQASHIDESESSEGEQEKKAGEAGSGTWTDGKPKTFGTMEDLCEEVEEETVDDDYNMGYTHVEDRDADQGEKVSEYDILLKDAEKVEEMVMSGVEGHSEEETEELTGANIDYDEELETDRLVEQELENLSTDSYSAHFGHEQVREDILEMDQKSIKEINEQENTGNTSTCESENYESALTTAVISKSLGRQFFSDSSPEIQLASTLTEEEVKEQEETEKAAGGSSSEIIKSESEPVTTITRDASEMQLFSNPSVEISSTNTQLVNEQKGTEKLTEDIDSSESEMSVNYEQVSSTIVEDVALKRQHFSESCVEINSTNKLTEEDVHPIDQEAVDNPETREDYDEHNLVSHVDATENHSELKDFLSRSDMEDSNIIEAPSSVLLVTADSNPPQDVDAPTENTEVLPEERSNVSQEHPTEDAEDFHKFFEEGETTEWENPENTTRESEMSDQIKHDLKNDNLHEISDEIIIHEEEPVEVSVDSALNENDIFKVKDVKDSSFHRPFTSDGKNDFWVSSLETGATYTPNNACNESAEQTNHNQGFADNRDWGNLENPKVVNGNSKVDIDPSGLDPTKEQKQGNAEVKKVFYKNVVEGEMVHSEESDVEAESWSSGEETA
ncbi:nestin [Poecilia reticulata]|uniref:Nestin n=1 Tax=Poecilia reticulata TaxID=8081 RepID=A0A3P9Q117_POERE|nr:PREDICTED: nestin [Poecilia reticulata]